MASQRTLEFHDDSPTLVVRDSKSIVEGVLHTQHPFIVSGATPREAAERYLRAHRELLGLDKSELGGLHLRVQDVPVSIGVEYRLLSEKRQFDVSTITFQLVYSGLPIRGAAISVHLKEVPIARTSQEEIFDRRQDFSSNGGSRTTSHFQVLSAVTTPLRKPAADGLKLPTQETAERLKSLDSQSLARHLGIVERMAEAKGEFLRLHPHQSLMIYRYDAPRRERAMQVMTQAGPADRRRLVLPDVPADIIDGKDYVVAAKYFDLKQEDHQSIHYVALVEANTHAVLYIEPLVGGVNGLVFRFDPVTRRGGPPPDASNDLLNPLRDSVPLEGLNGPNGMQHLIGTNVKIEDFRSPRNSLPAKLPGENFDFDVRTDEFAAVNAYFHCDRFFRLVEELGFERSDYFPGTMFPIRVDARGSSTGTSGALSGGSGTEVNAECRMKTSPGPDGTVICGIGDTIFCLAETTVRPHIGIANDWRVVLHELGGHGVLANHVNSTFFNFAHSAGDSLAAILNDPESNAPDKGLTFPWIPEFTRRHDRCARDGWGWDGPKDVDDDFVQLRREQILSSTHFRLYKSIGGGHPTDVDMRHFAASFTTWLILRAIKTLTPETNPRHASHWLKSLLVADAEDWRSKGHSGGAYAKVIYWAFEKQGLFGGAAPEVDVYIDDGRHGEYPYQADHASCPAIWNRRTNDGNEGHETPVPNAVNFAYVKVKNRGRQIATSVVVNGFQNKSQTGRSYPDDWAPLRTSSCAAADVPPQSLGLTVGPFEWIPSTGDNYILMAVSATRDPNNLPKFSTDKPMPDWRLVPNDNNLGMRKV